MYLFTNRETLLPALTKVIGAIGKTSMPILSNFLLNATHERLEITATDLEIELKTGLQASVKDFGKVTVPAKKLLDIVKSFPPSTDIKMKLDTENARLIVTCGRSRFQLGVLSADEFPMMPEIENGFAFALTDSQLKRIVDKTAFAMAKDDVRYYLNGVLFDMTHPHLAVVATDGHRLALWQTDIAIAGADHRIIFPHKAIMELKRQLTGSEDEVSFALSEKAAQMVIGDFTMTTKLIDGRYPEYERVVPDHLKCSAFLNRDELKTALNRTAILSNEKYKGVKITFAAGSLGLTANNSSQESAEEEIGLDYTGDEVTIGFNVGYIADALNAMTSQTVQVQFQDANSSSIWRGSDCQNETFVVMPMRL